jgi:hypothetical protein
VGFAQCLRIEKLIKEVDANRDDEIELTEFLSLVGHVRKLMLLDLNFRILAQPDVKNTFGPATSPAKLRMKLRKSRVSRCFLKADLDATLVQSNQGPVQLGYSRLLHRCHDVKMIMAPWFDSKDRVPGV